jgi:hypothetical protein
MATDTEIVEFDPQEIVRFADGEKVFGLKPSRLKDKIHAGEIPAPIPMSATERALGWTRQQIADHHAKMAALAAQRAKNVIDRPKQPQPVALANAAKFRKTRLQPPVAKTRRQSQSAA